MKLYLIVTPRAGRNAIQQIDPTHFKVWVTVPPEKGKANAKAIALLANYLDIAPSLLEIIGGATGRKKTVLLHE